MNHSTSFLTLIASVLALVLASCANKVTLGPDGKPIEVSPVKEGEVMSVEECARITLAAITERRREVVMTARGRLAMFLKVIAPGLVDDIARRAIEKGR